MEEVSASVQAICPAMGEALPEFAVGDCGRERSFGSGWERGTQLSVYMVRRGIS